MDWIEQLFGVAPDQGNGALEALIATVATCLVAVVLLRRYLGLRRSRGQDSVRS